MLTAGLEAHVPFCGPLNAPRPHTPRDRRRGRSHVHRRRPCTSAHVLGSHRCASWHCVCSHSAPVQDSDPGARTPLVVWTMGVWEQEGMLLCWAEARLVQDDAGNPVEGDTHKVSTHRARTTHRVTDTPSPPATHHHYHRRPHCQPCEQLLAGWIVGTSKQQQRHTDNAGL
jgi:hypothetical protein